MTVRACARACCSQSGLTMVATIASTSAPPASRAVTAAVGDHPATISDLASGPDMPKLRAEPVANSRPIRKVSILVVELPNTTHPLGLISKIKYGHDTR